MKQISINLGVALLAIFAPIKPMLLATFVLIMVDLIAGVLAARKRKEPITSAGFRRTITKIFTYEIALMLAFVAETYLTGSAVPLSKIVSGFIGVTELLSCFENINALSDDKLLTKILEKLNSVNK